MGGMISEWKRSAGAAMGGGWLASVSRTRAAFALASAVALASGVALAGDGPVEPPSVEWRKIADSRDEIPGTTKRFGSFNQPSVNKDGVVVFRARSVGSSEPVSGIFRKRMGAEGQPIEPIFLRGDEVPEPNNSDQFTKGGDVSGFREFPSIPRIDADRALIATRGVSMPVWIYQLPDGSEARAGTNGVFVSANGVKSTAMSLLGSVRDAETGELVFPWHSVPDAPEGTKFDVFPGSPALADGRFVASKANWTDPETSIGKTGVFVRDLNEPMSPLRRIASSDTVMPGQEVPDGGEGVEGVEDLVRFGSTASPSADEGTVVFLGVDNEDAPTMGGIYAAPIAFAGPGETPLTPLVEIGSPVPGMEEGAVFTRIGEALAFDGHRVGFWGAWGEEMREITLACPADGNPDLIAYCNQLYPNGYTVEVPVHQGVFVHDLSSGITELIAQTGEDEGSATDFLFWVFSGRVPDVGGGGGGGGGGGHGGGGGGGGGDHGDAPEAEEGEEEELARWRNSAFVAVASINGNGGGAYRVAYKAAIGDTQAIGLGEGPGGTAEIVLATGMPASVLDPTASATASISTVGIERESLRDGWFVVAAGAEDEVSKDGSFAGIYAVGRRRAPGDFNGDGRSDIAWFHPESGRGALWFVEGFEVGGGYTTLRSPHAEAVLVGTGDSDGDGDADMLWYDPVSRRYSVWLMDGADGEAVEIDRHVGRDWTPVAFTDVDGDRLADVVFRRTHAGSTEIAVWIMDGATIREGVLTVLDGSFDQVFVGNFDDDIDSEVLLRRLNSGEAGAVYTATFASGGLSTPERIRFAAGTLAPTVSPQYAILGTADTDGDGVDDVLWRGPNGSVEHWKMHELGIVGHTVISDRTGKSWSVVELPDTDGDGRHGVLFRHFDGSVWKWELDGTAIVESGPLRGVSPDWRTPVHAN